MFDLVSRGGWNARAPRHAVATTANETFLHHTGSAHAGATSMRAIQDFHMDVRGWYDIAYNFVIDPSTLVVYEGRGWGVRPAAQSNYNDNTWSVCVMGDYRSLIPSEGLLDLIAQVIRHGHDLGFLPLELTGGHRDAPGQATTCPGDNLAGAMPVIRNLLAFADMKPLQTWARAAYEWAMDAGVYSRKPLDDVRETIAAQRTMVFLHRHHAQLGHGGGIAYGTTVTLTRP